LRSGTPIAFCGHPCRPRGSSAACSTFTTTAGR
jgi:hypothetical protein